MPLQISDEETIVLLVAHIGEVGNHIIALQRCIINSGIDLGNNTGLG